MKTHFSARKAVTVAAGAAMAVMFVPVLTMPAMAAEPSPSASPSGSSAPAVTPPVVELAPSVLETSSSPARPPSHLDIRKVLVNPDGVELSRRLEFTIAPNCNVGADPSVSSIPNTITLGVGDHENLHVSDATKCDPQEIAPSDTRDYHWGACQRGPAWCRDRAHGSECGRRIVQKWFESASVGFRTAHGWRDGHQHRGDSTTSLDEQVGE